jgi:hypothetical protein
MPVPTRMTMKEALVRLLWCGAGSGDLKPLGAKVLVPASWTAGGIAEPRPVLEAEAATLAGRRMDLKAGLPLRQAQRAA